MLYLRSFYWFEYTYYLFIIYNLMNICIYILQIGHMLFYNLLILIYLSIFEVILVRIDTTIHQCLSQLNFL